MKIYSILYKAATPEGIEKQKAYIVGGGIAGLAAAAFLADDAKMPGENITIVEAHSDVGGAMDGIRGESGYLCRGERELEPYIPRDAQRA
jgi:oleate hydratase